MLRLPRIINQKLCEANVVQTSYRIRYQDTEGYLLLSQNKIRIIEERRGSYTKALELPYEHIASITSKAQHRLTIVDKQDQTHIMVALSGVTAYLIEEDVKSRIAPLDYPQQG
ncbi:MAG: hypothetical protein NWE83_07025 [Candidatus Bathyarchaeota archaeon]|jgi:hypothetical protein|nr:hypothetical protein [Candidatus Bathyarchaeota archaeon]